MNSNFDTSFEIIYQAIFNNLVTPERYPHLMDELIHIVSTEWAQNLLDSGMNGLYSHLRDCGNTPVRNWSMEELIQDIVDENSEYWSDPGDCKIEDFWALHQLNTAILKSFSPIELLNLKRKLAKAGISVNQ